MVLIPRRAAFVQRVSSRVGTSRAVAARLLEAVLVGLLLAAGAVVGCSRRAPSSPARPGGSSRPLCS